MKRVQLGDVARIETGTTPSTKNPDYHGGDVPFVKPGDLDNQPKIISEAESYVTDLGAEQGRIIPKNGVMVCCIGSLGKLAIAGRDMITNQQINSVIFDEGKVDPKFGAYFLSTQKKDLEHLASSTTVAIVNKTNFSKLEIPLPSLSEQKAIVAKLDRAQRLIDIDKEMLAKYDELIQSVFLEMFGDPVRNSKGWDRVPFKKLAEIDKESFDPTDFKGSVEYVGLNSIVKNSGKIIDVKIITEGDVKSNKYKFSPKHILYGKLRPYLNKVAFPDFNGVCSTDILPILPKKGISTKTFVGHLLKSKEFVSYADKNSSGANLPRISPTMVKKFEAFLPPLELQMKFDDLVNKIISEKQQTSKASQKSEELFSSLVQGAFG